MNHHIQAVVFDVGRVLIDFSYDDFFAWLKRHGARINTVDEFVQRTELLAYETGHISDQAFLDKLNALLTKPVTHNELVTQWLAIFTPAHDMLQLAHRLKETYTVVLLSNTSSLHWQHIVPRFKLDEVSHGYLASFEVGAMKPDPAIFHAAEEKFELNAQHTVFIDDIEANVQGALDCNWQGIHHQNSQLTCQQLQQLGVILE